MSSRQYESNRMLNDDISFDEVQKITNRLKNNKSSGIDKVPNEVMKKYDVQILLWNMYRLFFSYGLTPLVWLNSTISPIQKGSTKDPYAPLHYRGISLLSYVCKGYSSILNRRIETYSEAEGIFFPMSKMDSGKIDPTPTTYLP